MLNQVVRDQKKGLLPIVKKKSYTCQLSLKRGIKRNKIEKKKIYKLKERIKVKKNREKKISLNKLMIKHTKQRVMKKINK